MSRKLIVLKVFGLRSSVFGLWSSAFGLWSLVFLVNVLSDSESTRKERINKTVLTPNAKDQRPKTKDQNRHVTCIKVSQHQPSNRPNSSSRHRRPQFAALPLLQ